MEKVYMWYEISHSSANEAVLKDNSFFISNTDLSVRKVNKKYVDGG